MSSKSAYFWGPITVFSGPLIASLLKAGWQVHVAAKSALNVFTLSPLDLNSVAESQLEIELGGRDEWRKYREQVRILEHGDFGRSADYDVIIFAGLPTNPDESRVPRAPWSAKDLSAIAKHLKGVPIVVVSSLWSAIMEDGVVPEEVEFERRRPATHWEALCQQYESRVLAELPRLESSWHLVRLPLITGSTKDGRIANFSGLSSLFREVSESTVLREDAILPLSFNPNASLNFLPQDAAVKLFVQFIEDGSRPRICNLVSMQTALNREWVLALANAIGLDQAKKVERDNFELPKTLRQLIQDNVQVKTRNLFELAGRYQQQPIVLDSQYFEKQIAFGVDQNWGRAGDKESKNAQTPVTRELAEYYFNHFIPANMSRSCIKELTKGDTIIGFGIQGNPHLSWLLSYEGSKCILEPGPLISDRLKVKMLFAMSSLKKVASGELSLQRAVLGRHVKVEGQFLDIIRVLAALDRFIRENPYKSPERHQDEVVTIT